MSEYHPDDFNAVLARMSARPWWQKMWDFPLYRLPYILRHLPRDCWNAITRFLQRGRRGWSRQDVWSLDRHLSIIIPAMLRELVRQTKGLSTPVFFLEEEEIHLDGSTVTHADDSNERWVAWLEHVASAFEDYYDLMQGDASLRPFDEERYQRDIATMRELFDHFGDLWS